MALCDSPPSSRTGTRPEFFLLADALPPAASSELSRVAKVGIVELAAAVVECESQDGWWGESEAADGEGSWAAAAAAMAFIEAKACWP